MGGRRWERAGPERAQQHVASDSVSWESSLSPVSTVTCMQRPEIEAGTVRVGSKGTVPAILQEQQGLDSCSTVGNRESGRRGGPGLWLRGRPWWEQVYYTWEHNRFTSSSSLDDGRGHPFSLETYKIRSAFSFSKLWKLFLFLNDPIPPGGASLSHSLAFLLAL